MQERTFIEDQAIVEQLRARLKKTHEFTKDGESIFVDPANEQKWVKYSFLLDDEVVYGFRKMPSPSIEETLKIIFNSTSLDEVSGAVAFLSNVEYDDKTVRERLIKATEKVIDEIEPDRFEIIYERAELWDGTNNRQILGKEYSEVKNDYLYYQSLAKRADAMNEFIKNKYGLE